MGLGQAIAPEKETVLILAAHIALLIIDFLPFVTFNNFL